MTVFCFAQKSELRFNKDGKFKIVQFTDVHFKYKNPASDIALERINQVLDEEQPDFVIFTGDVVYSAPADKGMLQVLEQVSKRKLPFVVTFGNHDNEQGMTREQLGIMSSREALKLAREADLDLVKIAPNAKPPVCKIIDYGKYRYELARKEKEAKKKQKTMEVKEVRLSPNIDTNDLNTKANQARKFITKGDKVKVTLRFRGREMAHVNYSKQILDSFYEKLEDIAVIDKNAKMEGRSMVMFLSQKR